MESWNSERRISIPDMDTPKKCECEVCGTKFSPKKSQRYVTQERIATGGLSDALTGSYRQPKEYDTFDCPVCGCQFIAKERLRKVEV